MSIKIAGENSFIIYFGDEIDAKISNHVGACAHLLSEKMADFLIDMVPSYASLLVIFDQDKVDHYQVKAIIREALEHTHDMEASQANTVHLPVYYSTESGPDLATIAARAKLSVSDTIALHHQPIYRVYAIGFSPGFAYLGEVDKQLQSPRLSTPRLKVPQGAVAIADRQTAVYPNTSPGGWNLIGLCPTPMFDINQNPPMAIGVGDKIKFEPISRHEYLQQGGSEALITQEIL